MPTFALKTATTTKLLGTFTSKEEALKLRVFKDHPALAQYLVEYTLPSLANKITRQRVPLKSNRWRILFTTLCTDLMRYYTRAEAEKFMQDTLLQPERCKLLYVPKYAYHESDDIETTQEK